MTVAALNAEVERDLKSRSKPRIRLVPFNEIKFGTARRYLVKGLIPRVGLVIVWGPPKSGKSFWTLDVAMHVALGRPYRGRRVQPGPVVYCAFEGQSGLEARVEAFRQVALAGDPGEVPFYLQPVTLDLVADHAELIAVISDHLTIAPVVVALDTLNRSLRGSESSDEDMTNYIRAADAIREAFGCVVIIVHHCGVDGTRPRGHTALTGAADAQIAVRRDAADNIAVTVELAKDGPQGDTILSRLEVVDIGIDEDGEAVSSCVVMAVEGEPVARSKPAKKVKLSNPEQLVLQAIKHLVDHDRTEAAPSPDGVESGTLAVRMDDVREHALRSGFAEKDEPGGTVRARWSRALAGLVAKRRVLKDEDLIWLL